MAIFETALAVLTGAAGELLAARTEAGIAARKMDKAYRAWKEDLLNVEDEELRRAYQEFLGRAKVRAELAKALAGAYGDVQVGVLKRELEACCTWARCGAADVEIKERVRALAGVMTEVDAEPNYEEARRRYVEWVKKQHRHIRFGGMAEVDKMAEVEMARVFVMPRLTQENEKFVRADEALCGKREVVLGGPGAGKTTLLEYLCLRAAEKAGGPLPVFYRVRELEKDLKKGGTIWDCLGRRYSQAMAVGLPEGLFAREAEGGGVAFFFDGMDETSTAAKRNEMVGLLESFADKLPGKCRVVISSRPHDYRRRFEAQRYRHWTLCAFDDDEVQRFIGGWMGVHEPDAQSAREKGGRLWSVLESRLEILALARNALLLTMIVRVHFGLGALPDSRLGLYAKCSETLLKHWAEAKDLAPSPIDFQAKVRFLAKLAYEMQGEAEGLDGEMALQISKVELEKKLRRFLQDEGRTDASSLVDAVVERLRDRDAILVSPAGEQFGFVHRSFQEYYAAVWMAQELSEAEFAAAVEARKDGWDETLYLAVAQLPDRRRRQTLVGLLKRGEVWFALNCLRAAPPEALWLKALVRFLAKYDWGGEEFEAMTGAECAEACGGRSETTEVLEAAFARETRVGRVLAAAVELAEALGREDLLDALWAESAAYGLDTNDRMVDCGKFLMGVYPVTNREYECMAPGHRNVRDEFSNEDEQPVIRVNWYEARLFCRWRGEGFRLPKEEEWYRAAAWDPASGKHRTYPWGDEWDAVRCNTAAKGPGRTTKVGSYPGGVSALGCHDMAGNVWEWMEDERGGGGDHRALRGGAWSSYLESAACAFRYGNDPRSRLSYVGFRCARTKS